MNKKTYTRNEHYIPQFYFRQFSDSNKGIYRFDINDINSESVMVSINKQCSAIDLYEFINNDESIVRQNLIENLLAKFELEISKVFESVKKRAFKYINKPRPNFLTNKEKQYLTLFIALLIVRSPKIIELGKTVSKEVVSEQLTERESRNFALMSIFPIDNSINSIERTLLIRICEEFENMAYNVGISTESNIITNDFPVYLQKESENIKHPIRPDKLIFPLSSNLVLYMLPQDTLPVEKRNILFPLQKKLIEEEQFVMTINADKWLYSHKPITKRQKKTIYKGIKYKQFKEKE